MEKGQELVKQWLKAALMTKGASEFSFSWQCPKRLFQEMQGYKEHVPGTGPHYSLDAPRYFFIWWQEHDHVRKRTPLGVYKKGEVGAVVG